jgi:hypothetical protein
MRRPVTIQAGEVVAQCSFGVIAQRQFSTVQTGTGVPPRSTLLFLLSCNVPTKTQSS